jgi:hypothetical protein
LSSLTWRFDAGNPSAVRTPAHEPGEHECSDTDAQPQRLALRFNGNLRKESSESATSIAVFGRGAVRKQIAEFVLVVRVHMYMCARSANFVALRATSLKVCGRIFLGLLCGGVFDTNCVVHPWPKAVTGCPNAADTELDHHDGAEAGNERAK